MSVLVGIEARLNRTVADGMDSHLVSVPVSVEHDLVQLVLRHHFHAEVVWIGIFKEGLTDGGGSADQRSVGEELKRADAQAIVTESGTH